MDHVGMHIGFFHSVVWNSLTQLVLMNGFKSDVKESFAFLNKKI